MNVGPLWRAPRRTLGAFAALLGLTLLGLANRPRADEPKADEPAPAQSKATEAKATPGHKAEYIDEMLKEAWEQSSLKPSPLCTDEEYLRRAYLDVLGRIPNIEEASAFLSSKEKGKRAKLVEYLVAQPDYAKNFGNQFTILLMGGRKRQEREVDPAALGSWLRVQFNSERPWNEMVYDLITASGNNKTNGAVNYTLAHLENGAVPLTSITTRVFLGQQIQCTQCHDHPSNDWKQADFWGINAFLKGIRKEQIMTADATGAEVLDHVELSNEPTDSFAQYDKRNGLVGIAFPKFLDGRKISQGKDVDRRKEFGKLVADPTNADLSKAFMNRLWGHFMGRGIVHPLDDFGPHNPPSHPELLDKLGEEFQKANYDVKAAIRWLMNCQAYQLSSQMTKNNEKDESLFSHMALKPFNPEQLFDSLLTATSAHKAGGSNNTDAQRKAWLGQFIFAFANDEGEEGSTFQGTIPQALMMMNGELMEKAVGGKAGSFLSDLLSQAKRTKNPPLYMVNNMYLAALSRYPSPRELTMARNYLSTQPDTINVLEDVFWALLNSNEFVLNR